LTYTDPEVSIKLSGVPYSELGFNSDGEMRSWLISNIVPGIEAFIENRTHQTYTTGTAAYQAAVKLIAILATSNALVYYRVNKLGTILQTGQFKLAAPIVELFSKEMLNLLDSFKTVDSTQLYASTLYKTSGIKETWDEDET